MPLTSLLPILGGVSLVLFGVRVALKAPAVREPGGRRWAVAALASALFLALSMAAVLSEGPTGFWPEHTRNLWGNQIWFDLLFAASVAWFFGAPRARAVGMRLLPWFALIVATGSVGVLAFAARLLYLEDQPPAGS